MKTITTAVSAEIKILRSRFITGLYPISSAEEARAMLSEHTRQYTDATHNCYAYIYGIKGETSYYSDAGEPGGTAGKPMLNALLRNDLTNVLAVVTRYYGGIKLGVKGLIDAYGEAVEAAIAVADFAVARNLKSYKVCCDYACFETLKHRLIELEGSISEQVYAEGISFNLQCPEENVTQVKEILNGIAVHFSLDYQEILKGKE